MQRKFNFEIDGYYHLYNRGTEKRKIFLEAKDYQRFLLMLYLCNNSEGVHLVDHRGLSSGELFNYPIKKRIVDIGAHCLMPNHFHLLVREKIEGGISLFMRKLLTGHSMYFNKKNERSGALFQGPFKATRVDDDVYLQYLFAYIHLNPVKLIEPNWKERKVIDEKRVKQFLSTYTYSSYLEYCSAMARPEANILNRAAFPEYFADPAESLAFLYDWLAQEVNTEESPRDNSYSNSRPKSCGLPKTCLK